MSNYNGFGDSTGYGNYNNSSAGGFTDGGPSNSQQQKHNVTQTIIPATIKEINASTQTAQDSAYEFQGIEIFYVSFIGVIREVDTSNANATVYKIEDGTDATSFRQWNQEDSNGEPADTFQMGDYVKVVATLREFNSKKQLQTQSARKIKDFNEVPYHFLNAIKTYLDLKNGGSGSKPQVEGLFVSDNATSASGNSVDPTERVFKFISDNSRSLPEGVPIQLVTQEFNFSSDQALTYINKLADDGRIYASNDDDMYLAI